MAELDRLGTIATFLYDGRSFLARAEEMGTGNTTEPTYASDGLLYSLSHSQNGVPPIAMEHVLYFAGRPVAIVTVPPTGLVTNTFLSTDHLGTPFVATDDGADEIWAGGFEPFGRDWREGLPDGVQENGVFLRFPGQWFDSVWREASLGAEGYYNVHRWYEIGTGRYSRVDPAMAARSAPRPGGTPSGVSRREQEYTYVVARPLQFTDPLGLECTKSCPECPTGRWIGIGAQVDAQVGPLLSGGGNLGIVRLWCPSGKIRCDFLMVCLKVGVGVDLGLSAVGAATFGAKCSDDIESFTLGFDIDAGSGLYGSAGLQISVEAPSSFSPRISVGVGVGVSAGLSGCGAKKLGCKKQ